VVAEDSAKFNKEDNKEEEEEIHALLPHFLAFSSLAKAEVDGLRVLVLNLSTGHLSLLKPVIVEDDNFEIWLPGSALVALVANSPALHVKAMLVPFCARASLEGSTPSLLAIAILPDTPNYLQNLPDHLKGWKKVGYEQQCCVQRGALLVVRRQGQGGAGGLCGQEDGQQVGRQARDGDRGGQGEHGHKGKSLHLSLLTPPQTRSWVAWMGGVDGDFLDTSIVEEETGKDVYSGPLPLYSSLKIERDSPYYLPPPRPHPVNAETLADRPSYGKTTNLEPFFAAVRNGSLSKSSLEQLCKQLGGPTGQGVKEAVTHWKEKEGNDATLAAFLSMLQDPAVSLHHLEKEIRYNEENSRCGITSLVIH